jgi:hypothetical protein
MYTGVRKMVFHAQQHKPAFLLHTPITPST